MRSVRALLLALAFAASPALAAPFAVQVGEARIALDAPPGYADTTFTGSPRLQELSELLTSASHRILLFALSDADLRRFTVGDTPELRRYMLAVTPKTLERERATPVIFQRAVEDSRRELGAPPPKDADLGDYLVAQKPGVTVLLAELRTEPSVVSFLQGTKLAPARRTTFFAPEEKTQYLLSSTSLLLVRGKVLQLSVFTLYDTDADLDWIRSITARWIEDLQRLNNR